MVNRSGETNDFRVLSINYGSGLAPGDKFSESIAIRAGELLRFRNIAADILLIEHVHLMVYVNLADDPPIEECPT